MKCRYVWVALCSLAWGLPALAVPSQDSAISDGGRHVVSNNGECVRTKWQSPSDPCAPEPTPTPTPVVYTPPAPTPPPALQPALDQRTIYFEFNKADLSPESIGKLDALIKIILSSKGVRSTTVLGYADEIGKSDKNMVLSQRRAQAVNDYIATRVTIPSSVLMVNGKGEEASVTDCPKRMKRKERIACLAQDRRVEIEFNYVH